MQSTNETTEKLNLERRNEWMWRGQQFGIVVSCHGGGAWTWCLYALIYDNHPLFKDIDSAINSLPWHGGCTYDERFINEPARGIRYDWQRKSEWIKIGADYAHLHDDYFKLCDPADGIPGAVMSDVNDLFEALSARAAIAKATGGEA